MEDKVLISFQSKNALMVKEDLSAIALLAETASKAVLGMNTSLMGTKGSAGANSLATSLQKLDKQQKSNNKTVDQGKKGLDHYHKAQGAIRGQNEGMARSFSSMRNALLLYAFATAAVVRSLKQLVDVHLQWEASILKTNQLLKVTTGASGHTADQLKSIAVAMGEVTLESSQGVLDASNALLTFKSVSGDVFDRALASASDLASLGFGSIQSAAVQLGKALEDPAIGLASLKRVGVTFSKSQQKNIKLLVKQNQLFTAQEVILNALESQTKGAAIAAADGLAGALDSAAESSDNLKRALGAGGIGQVIGGVASRFAEIGKFLVLVDEKTSLVSGAILVALGAITIALIGVVVVIKKQLSIALLAAIAHSNRLAAAMARMTAATGLSVGKLLGVFTLLSVATGALVSEVLKHKALEDGRRKAIEASKQALDDLRKSAKSAGDDVDRALTALGKQTLATSKKDSALDQREADFKRIQEIAKERLALVKQLAKDEADLGKINVGLAKVLGRLALGIGSIYENINISNLRKDITVLTREFHDLSRGMGVTKGVAMEMSEILKAIAPSADFDALATGLFNEDKKRDSVVKELVMLEGLKDLLQDVAGAAEGLKSLGIDQATIDSARDMGISMGVLEKAIKKLRKEAVLVNADLELIFKGAKTFGITLPEGIEMEIGNVGQVESIVAKWEKIGSMEAEGLKKIPTVLDQWKAVEKIEAEGLKAVPEVLERWEALADEPVVIDISTSVLGMSPEELEVLTRGKDMSVTIIAPELSEVLDKGLPQINLSGEAMRLLDEMANMSPEKVSGKKELASAIETGRRAITLSPVDSDAEAARLARRESMLEEVRNGDFMGARQIEILDRENELQAIRRVGLVTQSESVVLQAELAEELLKTQESASAGEEVSRGFQLGIARMMQETVSYAEFSAQAVEGLFDITSGALDQMLDGQKVQWKSLFHSMLKDLAQLALRQALLSAVGGSGGAGGGLGGMLGGLFTSNAGGGTEMAGVPSLTGERGPELRLPATSGRIINATQMEERGLAGGGSPAIVNVNNILDPSMAGDYLDSPDGEQSILNVMSRNKTAVRAMLR